MRACNGTLESEQVTSVIKGSCFNLKPSKYSRSCELVNFVFPSTMREIISGTVMGLGFIGDERDNRDEASLSQKIFAALTSTLRENREKREKRDEAS